MKKVSNRMLAVAVLNIIFYTVAAIVLQFFTSVELSPTLTTCWYAFWTSEIFALTGIKISKVKHQSEEEVYDDEGEVDES